MNTPRSAQTPTISINAGATITCTVAAIAHHPDSGVIVTIPGNPNGFIPNRLIAGKNNATKAERRPNWCCSRSSPAPAIRCCRP